MKQSELRKRLEKIAKEVQEADLVQKCIRVVRVHGIIKTGDKCENGRYSDERVGIVYVDGLLRDSGGNLKVSFDSAPVFEVNRYGLDISTSPQIEGWSVERYQRGEWIKRVTELANKTPKQLAKERKPKVFPEKPEVDETILQLLRTNFRGFF